MPVREMAAFSAVRVWASAPGQSRSAAKHKESGHTAASSTSLIRSLATSQSVRIAPAAKRLVPAGGPGRALPSKTSVTMRLARTFTLTLAFCEARRSRSNASSGPQRHCAIKMPLACSITGMVSNLACSRANADSRIRSHCGRPFCIRSNVTCSCDFRASNRWAGDPVLPRPAGGRCCRLDRVRVAAWVPARPVWLGQAKLGLMRGVCQEGSPDEQAGTVG